MLPAMAEGRFFTLEQARALLPSIKPLAEALVTLHRELGGMAATVAEERVPDGLVPLGYFRRLTLMSRLERRIAQAGLMLKDRRRGLLDFPAVYGGRIVLLCWQCGEQDIGFWHDLESGFDGRRPVSELPPPTKPD